MKYKYHYLLKIRENNYSWKHHPFGSNMRAIRIILGMQVLIEVKQEEFISVMISVCPNYHPVKAEQYKWEKCENIWNYEEEETNNIMKRFINKKSILRILTLFVKSYGSRWPPSYCFIVFRGGGNNSKIVNVKL